MVYSFFKLSCKPLSEQLRDESITAANRVLPLLVPINREAGMNGFEWTFLALAE